MKSKFVVMSCLASALGLTGVAAASSIGVKYVDSDAPATLTSGQQAGAPGYVQDNWYNTISNGQAAPATPINNLPDGTTGLATGVSILSWTEGTLNNSWNTGDAGTDPNEILHQAYSDKTPQVTFTGVGGAGGYAPNGYTVVVYYGVDSTNQAGTVGVSGTGGSSIPMLTGPGAFWSSVGWLQGTLSNSSTATNFAVFSGLSDPTFTASVSGTGNDGITAIQIVQTPEPSTIALTGIAIAGLIAQRRRKPLT